MREREFMMLPQEESDDSSEEKAEKKSGKKSRFSRILELLLPKKGKQEESENSEVGLIERTVERAKGSFGRIFGIEKEEVPGEDSGAESESSGYEAYTPWLRLGNVDLIQSEVDEMGDSEALDNRTEHNGAGDETGRQALIEDIPDETGREPAELPSLQGEHDEQVRPEADEITQVESGSSGSRAAEMVSLESARANVQSEKTHQETIIDRRGGAGAALVGFVAAETLSRSRDKKIRKQAQHMNKQIENQEKTIENQNAELQKLQQRQQEQRSELHQKRSTEVLQRTQLQQPEVPKKQPTLEVPRPQEASKRTPERKLDVATPQHPEKQPYTPHIERTERNHKTPETDKTNQEVSESISPEERWHLRQIEQAAEQGIALETYYEKRHEAKDVPSAQAGSSAGYTVQDETSNNANQSAYTQRDTASYQSDNDYRSTAEKNYKTAAKQGALAGIAIIIAAIIIMLIGSLL